LQIDVSTRAESARHEGRYRILDKVGVQP